MSCQHENFNTLVEVFRLTKPNDKTVIAYSADIFIKCTECGAPFEFIGPPVGSSPSAVSVSMDRTCLRTPIKPKRLEA